jgi:hypothetical protein
MKSFVFPLAAPLLLAALGLALAGCGKDQPQKAVDEPKKATPVPSDMVFNDFVPTTGGNGIVGVKTDGGIPEGGLGPDSPAAADPGGGTAGGGGAEEAPKLKVTEPGAEPRVARKYTFVVGKTDKRLLTIRQSAGREGGGPAQEASFALTADFTPKAVKPTGTKFEMKVLKVDLPDAQGAQKAQAQAQLGAFAGLTGAFEISSHGEIGEVDFKADERMAGPGAEVIVQSLQQALELLVPPFPAEPIGVGAKWERKVERKERGQENAAKHSFTLTDVSAEGGTVSADVEVAVPKHPFQARGVPPGATEEVKGKGAYTYVFKFDHIASKVTGEMTITRRIEISDGKGGPKQSVAEIIKLKNQLETVTGGAAPAPAPAPKQ